MRLGLGRVAPVVARHVHRIGQRGRHLDERPEVGAAIFDNDDVVAPSSDRRLASAEPAEPEPTMTKSASSRTCMSRLVRSAAKAGAFLLARRGGGAGPRRRQRHQESGHGLLGRPCQNIASCPNRGSCAKLAATDPGARPFHAPRPSPHRRRARPPCRVDRARLGRLPADDPAHQRLPRPLRADQRPNSTCGEEERRRRCFGGSGRLVTAIEEAKARTKNWLLVDGGDQFQGSLFYNYYKGDASAEMMNKMGYDAMTVGNHEFDDGPEVLREFVDAVEFPLLMSNADISGEPLLADAIQKSAVIEKGGEQIGLIGLTPVDTPELASPGPNVIFTPPDDAVQAEVDRLTAEGVNKIIVLSHSGYSVDQRVAEATTGVDVIVGGHTNTLLATWRGRPGPTRRWWARPRSCRPTPTASTWAS